MIPEHPHEEVHRTGHRWIDLSAAGCALIVSVTSLFVAIRHGHSMERMAESNARLVEANSWPLLQRFQSDGEAQGPKTFSLDVINFGVGPAKVESVEVFYKGQPVKSPQELEAVCCNRKPGADPQVETSGLMGTVLRAGDTRRIITFPEDAAHAELKERLDLSNLTWRTCYCSVFDECWLSDLRTMHPPRIQECPLPKVPFHS